MLPRLLAGIACCLLPYSAALAQASPSHYTYAIVAADGDRVSNRPGPLFKLSCPVLNNAHQVAFRGALSASSPLDWVLRNDAGVNRSLFAGPDRVGDFTIDPTFNLACPSINEEGVVATAGLTFPGLAVTIMTGPPRSLVARGLGFDTGVEPSIGKNGYVFYRIGTAVVSRRCPNVDCGAD